MNRIYINIENKWPTEYVGVGLGRVFVCYIAEMTEYFEAVTLLESDV